MPLVLPGPLRATYQDVTVQGVVTFRVTDAATAGGPRRLHHRPRDRRAAPSAAGEARAALRAARRAAGTGLGRARRPLRQRPRRGPTALRAGRSSGRRREERALEDHGAGAGLGAHLVGAPDAPISRSALEAPTREQIQQQADEATFARRALAVEKERAIQENELKNQIELARREEELIAQKGHNAQREATEEATASKIATEAKADRAARSRRWPPPRRSAVPGRRRLARDEGSAARRRPPRSGRARRSAPRAEKARMEAVRDVPAAVLLALAAQALAGKLETHRAPEPGGRRARPRRSTRLLEAGCQAAPSRSEPWPPRSREWSS